MKQFPQVKDEYETLEKLLDGGSIARYGDGELKLCLMKNCVSQLADEKLAAELKQILLFPGKVLVGLPDVHRSPKDHWKNYNVPKFADLLNPKVTYYSSFITRPDNAPWIDTDIYWENVEKLWAGRTVTLVAGSNRSLRFNMMESATKVYEPYKEHMEKELFRRDAYKYIDQIEIDMMEDESEIILLCLGAAATCLAHRLAQKGKWAIDLGHLGMFMRHKGDYYDKNGPNGI